MGALGSKGQAPIDRLPQNRWTFEPDAERQAGDPESLEPSAPGQFGRVEGDESYGREIDVEPARPPDTEMQPAGRPNLSVFFTIAFLAFFFVGPRFLEGNAFLVVLVFLIAVRWLYGRWSRSPVPATEPNT